MSFPVQPRVHKVPGEKEVYAPDEKCMAERYLMAKATLALKRFIKMSDVRGKKKSKDIDTPKFHTGRVSLRYDQ